MATVRNSYRNARPMARWQKMIAVGGVSFCFLFLIFAVVVGKIGTKTKEFDEAAAERIAEIRQRAANGDARGVFLGEDRELIGGNDEREFVELLSRSGAGGDAERSETHFETMTDRLKHTFGRPSKLYTLVVRRNSSEYYGWTLRDGRLRLRYLDSKPR